MTISQHLVELRSRLVVSLFAILAGALLAFWRVEDVYAFLEVPLRGAIEAHPGKVTLVQTKVFGAFLASMKIAFFSGCVLASPVLLYQLWSFIGTGLYKHERAAVKWYAIPGFLLFQAGAAMAYFFVLPFATSFLVNWSADLGVSSVLDLSPYVSFVALAMFVFGLMFQLPMVMIFLMRLGVVNPATFRKYRRHATVANVALAMFLTPPDVVSQIVLAVCMSLLYEAGIVVGARVSRPREERPS